MKKKYRSVKIICFLVIFFTVAYAAAFHADQVKAANRKQCFLPDGVPQLSHTDDMGVLATPEEKATGEEDNELSEYEIGRQIADFAEQYLGYPYTAAGVSPSTGFDCSGFVYYVLNQTGHPTTARGTIELYYASRIVSKADLLPGDIIFFTRTYGTKFVSHVGIYIGNGQMIHAPYEGQTVQNVYLSDPYWIEHFYAYGRIR